MKNIFVIFILFINVCAFASENYLPQDKASLLRIDTIKISSDTTEKIFKYYGIPEINDVDSLKMGRFEVYNLGDTLPFQIESVANIESVGYEDVNFDNVLDIKIGYAVENGMELENQEEYYIYNNKSKRFEYYFSGIGLSVNRKDSTISEYGFSERGGNFSSGKVYKEIKGKLIQIFESEGDNEQSYKKALYGDSLILVERRITSHIDDTNLVDSTWSFLYDKLRITHVTKKKLLTGPPTEEEKMVGDAQEDATGYFLYQSEESFSYKKNSVGIINCIYNCDKVKNGEWKSVSQKRWHVRN